MKKTLIWFVWLIIGAMGVVLFLEGVRDNAEVSLWRPFDIVLGLIVMISAYDHLGLFWWRKRGCCDCKENTDERA